MTRDIFGKIKINMEKYFLYGNFHLSAWKRKLKKERGTINTSELINFVRSVKNKPRNSRAEIDSNNSVSKIYIISQKLIFRK